MWWPVHHSQLITEKVPIVLVSIKSKRGSHTIFTQTLDENLFLIHKNDHHHLAVNVKMC